MLAELSRFLLTLYRLVSEVPPEAFQRRALDALKEVLPFDSGLWGNGVAAPNGSIVHAVFLYEQPAEMMENYERIKDGDVLARAAIEANGRSINASPSVSLLSGTPSPALLEHLERYGMTHALSTVIADPTLGLFCAMSVYRRAADAPFTEAERCLHEAVSPHLVEAWTANRLRFLEHEQAQSGSAVALAICDGSGWLHNAQPSFAQLLRREWPDWGGSRVPDALIRRLSSAGRLEHPEGGGSIAIDREARRLDPNAGGDGHRIITTPDQHPQAEQRPDLASHWGRPSAQGRAA